MATKQVMCKGVNKDGSPRCNMMVDAETKISTSEKNPGKPYLACTQCKGFIKFIPTGLEISSETSATAAAGLSGSKRPFGAFQDASHAISDLERYKLEVDSRFRGIEERMRVYEDGKLWSVDVQKANAAVAALPPPLSPFRN